MDNENLVRMANRIALFFEAMPDRDEAVGGVAQHLRSFWEPRMRKALAEHAPQADAGTLHPLVTEALLRYGAKIWGG